MKLALLLGRPELRTLSKWKSLGNQFFTHYQKTILTWCAYDNLVEKMDPLPVVEDDVLIDIFAGMKREGVFGKCSFMQLAFCILCLFRIKLSVRSLSNRLSTSDGYSFKKIWNDYWNKNSKKEIK